VTVSHPILVRNALTDLVVSMLDAGSGPGRLVLLTKTNVEVARLAFSIPAFGVAADGMATANPIDSDDDAAGGTVSKAMATDSDGNPVFSCDVTLFGDGGMIQLSGLTVGPGTSVSLVGLTYTGVT
jgi:hypothetical protein